MNKLTTDLRVRSRQNLADMCNFKQMHIRVHTSSLHADWAGLTLGLSYIGHYGHQLNNRIQTGPANQKSTVVSLQL